MMMPRNSERQKVLEIITGSMGELKNKDKRLEITKIYKYGGGAPWSLRSSRKSASPVLPEAGSGMIKLVPQVLGKPHSDQLLLGNATAGMKNIPEVALTGTGNPQAPPWRKQKKEMTLVLSQPCKLLQRPLLAEPNGDQLAKQSPCESASESPGRVFKYSG
jgi:hypothetical protein